MRKSSGALAQTKPAHLGERSVARILGLDPGYGRLGYGCIEETKGKLHAVEFGCIETPKGEDHAMRLREVHEQLGDLLQRLKPSVVGVESLFFSKNVKTALAVGEARGVILLTLAQHNLSVAELSPQEVKMAVTGYGKAEKRQVQQMVMKILGLAKPPQPDDAADALALAIALSAMQKFLSKM